MLRLTVLLLLAFASVSTHAVVIYTDRTAWEAAVAEFTTETFDNDIANAASIVLDNGIVSTAVGGLSSFGRNNVGNQPIGSSPGPLQPGRYTGRVGGANHPETIEWLLPTATNAFFADFDFLNFSGLVTFGNFDGSGSITINIASIIGAGAGSFGIVGASNFSLITWDTNDTSEFFTIDNFSTSTVPEPTTLALLGLGLAGLGFTHRRKTRN